MHWWGKSSKEGKEKALKGCLFDTVHGKSKVSSEKKVEKTSVRHDTYIVSEKIVHSCVNYEPPSPFLPVSGSQSVSGRSCAQVSPHAGHTISTHHADSEIDSSQRTNTERGYQPSLLCSFARPDYIVETTDGKYIDMEFLPASVSTYNPCGCDNPTHSHFCTNHVSGYGTTRETATNFPSSSKQKDKSAIASKKSSREILRPSKSCLNNHSVCTSPKSQPGGSLSASAPNSSISSPLAIPGRVIHHDPLSNSGVGSGKSHAKLSHLCPECFRTPSPRMERAEGDVPELIYRQHSRRSPICSPTISPRIATAEGDVPELIFKQHSRVSPVCSPTISPRMARAEGDVPELIYRQHSRHSPISSPTISPRMPRVGTCSRVNCAADTPMHQPLARASEPPTRWSNDRKQQSYELPLPPETTSSNVPMCPSYFKSIKSQVHNLPSHMPRFKKGRLIGGGTFGLVYLGFDNKSGEMCAVKEVTVIPGDPKSKEGAQHLNQEIALLSQLHHPNIVQYYGSEMVDNNIYIYLEYVSGGSIYKLLQEYGPLGEEALQSFTKQILFGLTYLHAKNTVHRDVKGANILLEPCGCVKLADFGMAKHITGKTSRMSFKGSPYWIAPEVVNNSNADVSVDIWSLGCTVLEMATGNPPWGQYEGVAALFKIGNSEELPPIPDFLSEEGKDFIRICLQRDPLQRPTAEQLLKHPFVKSVNPMESHVTILEIVEAMHLSTKSGNQQRRNPQSLNPVSIHENGDSSTSISNAHSPKNSPCYLSPIGSLLPQRQSTKYMRSTRLSTLSPHGASGSLPTDPDIGAIQINHPRTPEHMSEILSPTPIATPHGTHISTGNVMASHHLQSPKHRCGMVCPSLTSSPCAASRRNFLGHPAELELGNRFYQQRLIDHVKFNHQ